MEVASTREHLAISRRHVYTFTHLDCLRTNEKRKYHGLYHGQPGLQSATSREWKENNILPSC